MSEADVRVFPSSEGFSHFLGRFTALDVMGSPKDNKVLTLKSSDGIFQALQVMCENQILSIPIYSDERQEYIGLVDVIDIVGMMLISEVGANIVEAFGKKDVDWDEFGSHCQKVLSKSTLGDVIEVSGRNPWCPVQTDFSLEAVMDMLGREINLHRVPVVGDGEYAHNILGIISQSKIIDFLQREISTGQFSEDIGDLKPLQSQWYVEHSGRPVVSVGISEKLSDAGKLLIEKKVSGLAVVDDAGVLVGSLSGSDFKAALGKSVFQTLQLPVGEFLQIAAKCFNRNQGLHPITCTEEDSVKDILAKLHHNHIHRLFIVDSENKPTGVLSLCDIITYLNGKWNK